MSEETLDFGGRGPAITICDWDDCEIIGPVRLDARFRVVTAGTVRKAQEAKRTHDRVRALRGWRGLAVRRWLG